MDENYFHICNRGIDKSKIFFDQTYYLRFVIGLYRYNNKSGAIRMPERVNFFSQQLPKQDKLVEILNWTLLPNHYHLLVQETESGGAVEFTKRLGNGYTKYVNTKRKRNGYLFQNAARIIMLENERHFLYLPFYIDLNILDARFNNWKNDGIPNVDNALEFMEQYRWSGYGGTVGRQNFLEITNRDLFYETFNTDSRKYKEEVKEWLEEKRYKDYPSTWQVDG